MITVCVHFERVNNNYTAIMVMVHLGDHHFLCIVHYIMYTHVYYGTCTFGTFGRPWHSQSTCAVTFVEICRSIMRNVPVHVCIHNCALASIRVRSLRHRHHNSRPATVPVWGELISREMGERREAEVDSVFRFFFSFRGQDLWYVKILV